MKLKALSLAMFTTGLLASIALAGPPAGAAPKAPPPAAVASLGR